MKRPLCFHIPAVAMFPVETAIPEIAASLARNRSVVLTAPPGSGKTTCVPPALLSVPFLRGKKILMLEPRRLAARNSAVRIASMLGESVGETVGYQVRLERKISSSTRLEILTEGLLARRLAADPELSGVGLVVFDEFHERSIHCDLALALCLDVRRNLRDDLRIMVMSATLDAASIAGHLGDADTVSAEGRMYPVETKYLLVEPSGPVAATMANAVRRVLADGREGDVLCFLPGEGEIRRAAQELHGAPRALVLPLYGAMPRSEQDRVFEPAPAGMRKVILATSIAETSVTFNGVTTVVDSGLMRVNRFSPASGMNALETLRLTRDRADQRRGRAGRTAPGVCLRLWTEDQDKHLAPHMPPEILDADLASAALLCASWGAIEPDDLPWPTPPPKASWQQARSLLAMLGAIADGRSLTPLGRKMLSFGAHPRLAAMMLARPGKVSATLAAIIEEGGDRRTVDIRRIADRIEGDSGAFARRVRELASRWAGRADSRSQDDSFDFAGENLAHAFPDRVAKNRGNGTFAMLGGRGAWIDKAESISSSPFLVCCNLDAAAGQTADAKIHLAAPLSPAAVEDIFRDSIRECRTCVWDASKEQVAALRERRLGKIVLSSVADDTASPDAMAAALAAGIRKKGVAQLAWTKSARDLQARICFLNRVAGAPWPDLSDAAIEADAVGFFGVFLDGCRTWRDLCAIDLCNVLSAALGAAGLSRRVLDRMAPLKMSVPSGSEITIHYDAGEPYAAVRLQETFGLQDTPLVADGRAKVVMHLLSPAQRPVQITKDLAGFWRNSYQLVRKDLRGRYPKHYWPEDPLAAVATRRVRPPN